MEKPRDKSILNPECRSGVTQDPGSDLPTQTIKKTGHPHDIRFLNTNSILFREKQLPITNYQLPMNINDDDAHGYERNLVNQYSSTFD